MIFRDTATLPDFSQRRMAHVPWGHEIGTTPIVRTSHLTTIPTAAVTQFSICSTPITPRLGAELSGGDVWLYDNYQDEIGEKPKWWYQFDADQNSRACYRRTPAALVIGVDRRKPYPRQDDIQFYEDLLGPNYHRGAHCDARAGIEELAARITFTRRVFLDP
jgi:hypothetical protein